MRNRDYLIHTNEYDILCKMNDNLLSRQNTDEDDYVCVMDAVGVCDIYTRCRISFNKDCKACIAAWLNEKL